MSRKFKVIEHAINDQYTRKYIDQEVEEVLTIDEETIVCKSNDGIENDFCVQELEEII